MTRNDSHLYQDRDDGVQAMRADNSPLPSLRPRDQVAHVSVETVSFITPIPSPESLNQIKIYVACRNLTILRLTWYDRGEPQRPHQQHQHGKISSRIPTPSCPRHTLPRRVLASDSIGWDVGRGKGARIGEDGSIGSLLFGSSAGSRAASTEKEEG